MKRTRVRVLASSGRLLCGFTLFFVSSLALAAGPGWYNNFEQAVQAARQQGRPIFVDFSTSWCSVCKQMDRTTLSDPAIISRLDNFVKVKVDGDARQDLCSAFGVEAYPTFIHLSPTGQIVEKREGSMRVQEMAGALDRTWQSLASSVAVAQVNNNREAAPAQPASQAPQVASAELNLLSVKENQEPASNSRSATRENSAENARQPSGESLYNRNDPQLQGSVYAMGAGPTSGRRSRFGGGATDESSGLRQLAEATANPGDVEDSRAETEDDSKAEDDSKKTAESNDDDSRAEDKEVARAGDDAKSDTIKAETVIKKATDKKSGADSEAKVAEGKTEKSSEKSSEVASSIKIDKETKQTLAKPEVVVASATASPVIESRLAGLSEEALPKPLLSRSASGATQELAPAPAPAPAAESKSASSDPLATIRRIQRDDTGAKAPAVSEKTQEISAEKSSPANASPKAETAETKTSEKSVPEKTTAKASPDNETEPAAKKPELYDSKKSDDSDSKKSESKEVAKTSEGATKSDIERWMKDADSKLIDARKKEARAMYAKVVDKDPDNKFGKSDMAYVKMVSLIVDKDSDLLRRQAYNKIKEFETRFPESDHKDYYTLIRAILAADLGETSEAHKLLGSYGDNFPDSKYVKMAHETWKSLPDAKKSSSKSKSSADSGKSRSSNNG